METLDKLEVVGEACYENVFVVNHCKSIVSNSEKLCSLALDEPAFDGHISESFGIYSEHHQIILSKRLFTKLKHYLLKSCELGLANSQNLFQMKLSQDT